MFPFIAVVKIFYCFKFFMCFFALTSEYQYLTVTL